MPFKNRFAILLFVFLTSLSIQSLAQVSFTSSKLPIIVIDTEGKNILDEPKITAHMGIIHNGSGTENKVSDAFNDYDGTIGIEVRGSSSQMFPKKQYGIELRNEQGEGIDAPLLGLPEEEDWILYAPFNDKSLMRDALAYKLGREMGRYAPRTRYCEVVLNGSYQGVYVLIEKIKRDKNRVDISNLKPGEISGDDLTGGYILKVDKDTGSGGDGWESDHQPLHGIKDQNIFFQYQDPKPDKIADEQKEYIQNFMKDFENALAGENFQDPEEGYARYIDVPSFIDFFIASEVTKNVDAYRISTFFHKQKITDGNKLVMGPVWDFNLGFGNADYCTKGNPQGFVIGFNKVCPDDYWLIPFWWERLFEDENFHQQVLDRWKELREGPFQTAKMTAYVDSVAAVMNEGPQQRNFKAWPVLGTYVWPNYYVGNTYQEEVMWLKNWITARMEWLDVNLPGKVTALNDKDRLPGFSITTGPVPFQEVLKLEYAIPKPGKLSIELLDLQGRTVLEGEFYDHTQGTHQSTLNTSQLSNGIYLLKVQFENGAALSKKVIKN